jgi:hypothetical protein
MTESDSDSITQIRNADTSIQEKVRDLCELSSQLQEYSRALRRKSEQINERLQLCLNSKRAA